MRENIQQKLEKMASDLVVEKEPPLVMLTSMDKEGKEIVDLTIDVYAKEEESESIVNISLYDLIKGRLNLYDIDPDEPMELYFRDELDDFKVNILNIMLLKTYDAWKAQHKDMPYEKMKGMVFPKDFNVDII